MKQGVSGNRVDAAAAIAAAAFPTAMIWSGGAMGCVFRLVSTAHAPSTAATPVRHKSSNE
jgi:hypothetical protein